MIELDSCLRSDTPILVTKKYPDKKGLLFPKKKPYFIKHFNPSEFIGEELCLMNGIRCSHYSLVGVASFNYNVSMPFEEAAKRAYPIMIGSKNFEKKGYSYVGALDLGIEHGERDFLEKLISNVPDKENQKQLRYELLQMMALDMYMGQTDRYSLYSNYKFEVDPEGHVHLAPLYDFEHSFKPLNEEELCCCDLAPLYSIETAREVVDQYPELRKMLRRYLDTDLESAIRCAYAKRGLTVPEREFPNYRRFEEKQKEKIKRIV